MRRSFLSVFCGLLVCLLAASSASAAIVTSYAFDVIVDENATGVESQLFLQVVDIGPNQVRFDFRNMGPRTASITDVYFDDGSLLGISSLASSPGASFSAGAPHFPLDPEGNYLIDFNTSANFLADSNPDTADNGVNAGEYLSVTFNLIAGQNYSDVIDAMDLSLLPANVGTDVTGGLRVAIDVANIDDEGSGDASFVNGQKLDPGDAPDPIPEPATLAIWSLGLGIAGLVKLRRKS